MTGLVLCGGAGSRLGQEKALLNFHGQSQFSFLFALLESSLGKALLSCRKSQEAIFPAVLPKVFDSLLYENAGPLTGILSAHLQYPDEDLLVLACDYPAVNKQTLGKFLQKLTVGELTIFYNSESGFYESVLGYYPRLVLNELDIFYKSGGRSIQDYIRFNTVKPYTPTEEGFFANINTHEDLMAYIKNKSGNL